MKCEVCLGMLEEYVDRELTGNAAGELAAHLVTCVECAGELSMLTSEQELFAHYDRDLEVPASLWQSIAERTTTTTPKEVAPISSNGFGARLAGLFSIPSVALPFAGALATLLVALLIGAVYLGTRSSPPKQSTGKNSIGPGEAGDKVAGREEYRSPFNSVSAPTVHPASAVKQTARSRIHRRARPASIDQSDVLSADLTYSDIEDRDTAKHIERTQNLLRSIRNFQVSDSDDDDVDVTYDKALSRRLLNENIILRRDAEMKAKFPAKTLLNDLEPFLIDIANLPDKAKPAELRTIKERVERTEIVAALLGY